MPTVLLPTRVTSTSSTLIDHIYYYEGSNVKRNVAIKSGNLLNDLSDHLPNFTLIMQNNNPVTDYKRRPLIRIFSEKNKQKFAHEMASTDWNNLFKETDVNVAYQLFIDKITSLYERCFRQVQISRKRFKDKKWITWGLKKSSREKENLYKKWISTKSSVDESKFKEYRKRFNSVAKEAESMYYRDLFDSKINSVKKLWQNLNTICALKKK